LTIHYGKIHLIAPFVNSKSFPELKILNIDPHSGVKYAKIRYKALHQMKEERHITAALGYLELGMFDEAVDELHCLPVERLGHPGILQLESTIHIRGGHYEQALEISTHLCQVSPENPSPWLDKAFCLHELSRTSEARECLLHGPPCLKSEATYYYNLACYETQLGSMDTARHYLEKAITMEARFLRASKNDPDLAPLYQSN
jgi:tetratricopeptide (TPR) repeat protein